MATSDAKLDKALDYAQTRVVQLNVSVRCYEGRHKLPAEIASVAVRGEVVDDDKVKKVERAKHLDRATAHLLPESVLDEFNALVSRKTALLSRMTQPLRFSAIDDAEDATNDDELVRKRKGHKTLNLRLMPLAAADDVFKELLAIRAAMATFAERLRDRWDTDVLDYNRNFWVNGEGVSESAYRAHILSKLPTKADVVNRYGLIWGVFRITAGDVTETGSAEIRAVAKQAKEASERMLRDGMRAMIAEPQQALADALVKLQKQLLEGQVIKPGTFTNVSNAVALMRSFGEFAEPRTMAEVDQLAAQIDRVIKAGAERPGFIPFRDAIAPMTASLNAIVSSAITACKTIDPVAGFAGRRLPVHRGRAA